MNNFLLWVVVLFILFAASSYDAKLEKRIEALEKLVETRAAEQSEKGRADR